MSDRLLFELQKKFSAQGLSLRGGFNFESGEAAPLGCVRQPARAVLLIGNIGGIFWPRFEAWQRTQGVKLSDPLDAWSREVIGKAADRVGARAVSPSDRPFLPFQHWAMRAERLQSSPLGILVHPEFGLWHAYRGALLFDRPLSFPVAHPADHSCTRCSTQPCRKRCPVNAHETETFAYADCQAQLNEEEGANCMLAGCMDRNACPVGIPHRYPAALQQFLMNAFARE